MESRSAEATWERLATLLKPIHESAVATARRLCRSRSEGDDLYQESVLRAFEKLHTLRDEFRFRSWFYATLLSRHRSRSRRLFGKRQVPLEEAFARAGELVGEDGRRWAGQVERAKRAAEALSTLDALQHEVIVLFEIDGYSIEEVAEMQRASVSAVKSRLSRGRLRLRRFYERRGWDAGVPADPVAALESHVRNRDDRVPRPRTTPLLATAPGLETVKERSHE
jgi:RNA polymerase sigma-70 factor (ECF subfamily)